MFQKFREMGLRNGWGYPRNAEEQDGDWWDVPGFPAEFLAEFPAGSQWERGRIHCGP